MEVPYHAENVVPVSSERCASLLNIGLNYIMSGSLVLSHPQLLKT